MPEFDESAEGIERGDSVSDIIRRSKRRADPSYGVGDEDTRRRLRREERRAGGSRSRVDTVTVEEIYRDDQGNLQTRERVVTPERAKQIREERRRLQREAAARQEAARQFEQAFEREARREAARQFTRAREEGRAFSVGEASFEGGGTGFVTDTGQRVGGFTPADYSPARTRGAPPQSQFVGYEVRTAPDSREEQREPRLSTQYTRAAGRAAVGLREFGAERYEAAREQPEGSLRRGANVVAADVALATGELAFRYGQRDPRLGREIAIGYGLGGAGGIGFSTVRNVFARRVAGRFGLQAGLRASRAADFAAVGAGAVGVGAVAATSTPEQFGAAIPGLTAGGVGFSRGMRSTPGGVQFRGFSRRPAETDIQVFQTDTQLTGMGTVTRTADVSVFGRPQEVPVRTNVQLLGSRTRPEDPFQVELFATSRGAVDDFAFVTASDRGLGAFDPQTGAFAVSGRDFTLASRPEASRLVFRDVDPVFNQLSRFEFSRAGQQPRTGLSLQQTTGFSFRDPQFRQVSTPDFSVTSFEFTPTRFAAGRGGAVSEPAPRGTTAPIRRVEGIPRSDVSRAPPPRVIQQRLRRGGLFEESARIGRRRASARGGFQVETPQVRVGVRRPQQPVRVQRPAPRRPQQELLPDFSGFRPSVKPPTVNPIPLVGLGVGAGLSRVPARSQRRSQRSGVQPAIAPVEISMPQFGFERSPRIGQRRTPGFDIGFDTGLSTDTDLTTVQTPRFDIPGIPGIDTPPTTPPTTPPGIPGFPGFQLPTFGVGSGRRPRGTGRGQEFRFQPSLSAFIGPARGRRARREDLPRVFTGVEIRPQIEL